MELIIEESLISARALRVGDEGLVAALELSRATGSPDARFLLRVLPLPQDDRNNVRAAAQPQGLIAQRRFMCPELHRAAFSGAANELQRLLQAADSNLLAHDGRCSLDEVTAGWNTVLHIAAGQGHVLLVRRLFDGLRADAAALLPCRNSKFETALHVAARAGHHEMVFLLITLAQDHVHGPGAARVLLLRNSRGDTALHVAARHGRQAVVERLMGAAPALSCGVNDAGVSPLYLAVSRRSLGIVKALVGRRQAAASASGPNGQNALHAAVLQSAEITHEVLTWSLDLANETDGLGSTPLHYAASDGDREIISQLISSVPSAIYLQDKQGFTPLHIAAWMGHVDVIHDILQACPDSAEIANNNGRNFLHVAIERGHESVVKYVVGSPFAGGVVNEQDNNGNTPLHLAVLTGKPKLTILQSELLDLNIANNEGRTPFDLVSDITSFLPMIGFVLKLSAREVWIGTRRQDFILPWKGVEMKEWIEKLSKNLGIVAVLIATIALTAMFNVPGGYDSKGMPNLRGTLPYNAFLLLDTVAVASSMIATMLLIYGRGAAVRSSAVWICLALIFLWCALMSMILSFMAAVVPGLDNVTIIKKIMWCIFALPFFSLVVLSFVWAAPAPTITSVGLLFRAQIGQDQVRTRRHTRRRFPLVGFYLSVLYLFWFLNAMAFAFTLHIIMITI